MKYKIGMYARFNGKIGRIKHICTCEQCKARGYYEPVIENIHGDNEYVSCYFKDGLKTSNDILDLLEVQDLMYIDISPNDVGPGIIVPRIAETINELNKWKLRLKSNECKLVGVTPHEILESQCFRIGDNND